jgi:hypothetical protein
VTCFSEISGFLPGPISAFRGFLSHVVVLRITFEGREYQYPCVPEEKFRLGAEEEAFARWERSRRVAPVPGLARVGFLEGNPWAVRAEG